MTRFFGKEKKRGRKKNGQIGFKRKKTKFKDHLFLGNKISIIKGTNSIVLIFIIIK